MSRTVAVLGPGAVGGSLAVRLSLAGIDTICVGHAEAVGLIALAGLEVESRYGTLSARTEVSEQLVKPVDLLLVTVKAPSLEEALERIEPSAVSDGVVVPLLNGLEHMELLRARFGERVAAGSISRFHAYRAGPVQIIETTPSPVITVASGTLYRPQVDHAVDLLRQAGLEVRIEQDEKRVLWHKLARIAPLAATTAASGGTVGELRDDPAWRARLEQGVVEACAVAAADGVPLLASEQWTIIEEMADDTTTSAARDVAGGRPSELDAIVGAVLRAADRLGVPCPTLTELAAAFGLG